MEVNTINSYIKKPIQWLCYYILPATMLILVLIFQILNIDIYNLLVKFGEYSLYLILIIMFIKPLVIIFEKIEFLKIPRAFRREMGVLAFWFAMFHAILLMFYLELFNLSKFNDITNPTNLIFWGLLAVSCMFVLGITSNTLSVIKFGKKFNI